MSEIEVGRLYDALHVFERRRRGRGAYPLHKTLQFDEPETRDVYDWIVSRIDIPDGGSILDAGCGVGFGALRLAQKSKCRVTGISLSARELTRARNVAAQLDLTDRVEFLQMSFDGLPQAAYDLVVAVESLKHSCNLERSLRAIVGCLKRGGQLVIVEDLVADSADGAIAERLAADWNLTRLYTEADYVAALGHEHHSVVDLTDRVRLGSTAALDRARRTVLELLLRLAPTNQVSALRAYRGGLHLERLYAEGQIAYKAILYRNQESAMH
jgi:SAM-dependent methyltransferase